MSDATTYRVEFERIGRTHNVEPIVVEVGDADQLAELIHSYARPHLGSRDVDVVVDLEAMAGSIFCGFHSGGNFTVAEVAPTAEAVSR